MSKTWLVTGGLGFIGTNLCNKIRDIAPDDKIVVVDNSDLLAKKDFVHYKTDVLDYKKLETIFEKELPNYVIHLAAKTDVRKSLKVPFGTVYENLNGVLNCIDISYRKGAKNFVFVSSCGIVGDVEQSNEETIINPLSPYTTSKVVGEFLCLSYAKMKEDFCVSVLRLSNVYGKHSLQKNSVIPKFIKNILNEKDIVINGDGEQTRDFIYVNDVVDVIIRVIEKKCSGIFCVSSFQKTSINEIIKILSEYAKNYNYVVNIKHEKRIRGEIINSLVDNTKIRRTIGFDFNMNIKETIIELFDWFRKETKGSKIV